MPNDDYGYVEHQLLEVAGFRVVDATATQNELALVTMAMRDQAPMNSFL